MRGRVAFLEFQQGKRYIDERFGVGAWVQHIGRDVETQSIKPALPKNAAYWLAGNAPQGIIQQQRRRCLVQKQLIGASRQALTASGLLQLASKGGIRARPVPCRRR